MMEILAFIPNVGPMEITIIFVAMLVLFGAKKLPEFAKGLGKSMGEFKRARQEFEDEIHRAEDDAKDEVEPAAKVKESV